jgi:transglutaminase-like putative cysteine protease
MIYHVLHTTTYSYSEPVSLCHNLAHLMPRACPRQATRQSQLLIDPLPAVTAERLDFFGNPMTFFTIQEPHRRLTVTAMHQMQVLPSAVPDPVQTPPWGAVRELLANDRTPEGLDACQFVFDSPYVTADADLADYAAPSFGADRPVLDAVLDLTQRIHEDFRYDPDATSVTTPLSEVLAARRGVCQDFAHLQIGCLRALGLPARYVSGYLLTAPPPGQERLVGADASHAWLSVYCPGIGWVDVDPTNNVVPSDQHVVLAWGRDYDDVSPIKGVILGGGQHAVAVSVDVVPADVGLDRDLEPLG